MIQKFDIPGRLDGCNEYTNACRTNARAGGRMKRDNQAVVELAIKAARIKAVSGSVNVSFRWIEPNMRRDKDNIRFAAKFILDALVDSGIIKNDNWTHIGNLTDTYAVNKKNPRIEVTLEEVYL